MKHKQLGFSAIEAIIIVVIVSLLAAAGWYVWSNNKNDMSATPENTESPTGQGQYNWSTSPQGPYYDKVSFATSSDLLNWTDSGQILAQHASVPDIALKNGTLYLYFVDVTTDGKPEQIGLKTSTNKGTTWSDRQIITITGAGDKVPVDPDPFVLPDGRIRLYYFDIAGRAKPGQNEPHRIYSAISSDGINFTQEDGVRFEYANIYDPDVIKVGNTWRMYVGNPEGQKVISATSQNGLNFAYEGVAYEGSTVPNAIYESEKYYLYTAGINIAESSDGKSFGQLNYHFRSPYGLTADPGVVKLGPNNYLMVYKTSDITAQGPPPLGNQ